MEIVGLEGKTIEQLNSELARGGKFVVYLWVVSIVIMSFKRSSSIHYIAPGESATMRGLPYTLCSALFGWWGIPWGIFYTFEAIAENLSGGRDVTEEMKKMLISYP